MALGAGRGQVRAQVLREGLTLSVAGLCCGVLGCLGLARGVGAPAGLFHGVDVTDPLTLGVVALLLLGVAAGACLAPARRATRVDPAIALRGD
jgi:ABC-type antimicrobial peptide transport system permease subunit